MFIRFTCASVLLAVFALRRGDIGPPELRSGFLLGALIFLGYWTQTRGLLVTTPSRSAFLTGLAVVLVPLCDFAMYRTRITRISVAASLMAFAGLFLLFGGFGGRPNSGDLLTLICSVAFAVHMVLNAAKSRITRPLGLTTVQVASVALLAIVPAASTPRTPFTTFVVFTILGTAIFNTAIAFFIMVWAQRRLSATETGIVLTFEPVAAAATALTLGGETATPSLLSGGALIVFAMLLSHYWDVPVARAASDRL